MKVAILGAGDIGCAVGIALAVNGSSVTFIGRDSPTGRELQDAVCTGGALLVHSKWKVGLSAEACTASFTTDVARLSSADVILLACKRHHNAALAQTIIKHAKSSALLVVLQNGVGVEEELRQLGLGSAGPMPVQAVVNFNIVREILPERCGAIFHWTSPRVRTPPAFLLPSKIDHEDPSSKVVTSLLAATMDSAGLMATTTDDIGRAAYGKLIVNAGGNAINALSGVDIRSMIRTPGYRKLIIATCREVEAVYRASAIEFDGSSSAQYIRLLSLPSALVWLVSQMLIGTDGRASMWSDLHFRRPTEIEYLNGYVVALGKKAGVPTPVNARLCELVRAAEAANTGHPNLSPEAIARTLDVDVAETTVSGGGSLGAFICVAAIGVAAIVVAVRRAGVSVVNT